jgi:hypothetical protein
LVQSIGQDWMYDAIDRSKVYCSALKQKKEERKKVWYGRGCVWRDIERDLPPGNPTAP